MAAVLPELMSMCYDPVPNVRLCLATMFTHCMEKEAPLGDVLTAVGHGHCLLMGCFRNQRFQQRFHVQSLFGS